MAGSWLLPFNLFRLRNIKHCCVVSTISLLPTGLPTLVVELPPSALPSPAETRESPFRPFRFSTPGGIPPYMGYIGMSRCERYGFQAVYSRIGYINHRVRV